MDDAGREDVLLAVYRYIERFSKDPDMAALSDLPGLEPSQIAEGVASLVASGDLHRSADGTVSLTPAGTVTAEMILRRHRTLETFFQEMLGMDHPSAHAQACTMEHHASEETINRLRSFIRDCPPCHQGRTRNHCRGNMQTLADDAEGACVIVEAIRGCGRAARLADLGILPGEEIVVRQKLAHTLIVQVKGCDIAISEEIARSIITGEPCRLR